MIAALFDHLWQSTLVLAGAGLLTLLLHNNRAALRYWLWLAASLKFLVPFAWLAGLAALLPALDARPDNPALLQTLAPLAQPFSGNLPLVAAAPMFDWSPWLLTLWGVGIGAIIAFWLVRGFDLRALARRGHALPLPSPVPVIASARQYEPGLVGIWRPVLLMPDGIAELLSPSELDTILAHELCHWRRRDNLTAALHMLVSALFWFWPPVWWLGTRLVAERERACDEAVVAESGEARTYADAILKVCKFYLHSPLVCASGVSGGALKLRMEAIMAEELAATLGPVKLALLGAAFALTLALPIAAGWRRNEMAPAAVTDASAEAFIRRQIALLQQGRTDYSQMTPQLVAIAREQEGAMIPMFRSLGPLREFRFLGRDADGAAVFAVAFQKLRAVWAVTQDASGKFNRSGFGMGYDRPDYAHASPGTEGSVRRYVLSLQAGKPNLDEMTPGMAETVASQAPTLIALVQGFGAMKSLSFKGVRAPGVDVYDVRFEKGHAEWMVAPLTQDGKVQARGFRILP